MVSGYGGGLYLEIGGQSSGSSLQIVNVTASGNTVSGGAFLQALCQCVCSFFALSRKLGRAVEPEPVRLPPAASVPSPSNLPCLLAQVQLPIPLKL
jgi:hypothetical protein